jgi:hypothetical protein
VGISIAFSLLWLDWVVVRRLQRRFAVIGEHAIETTEDIVERHLRYAVVEKHEDVAELAERSDPRRRGTQPST